MEKPTATDFASLLKVFLACSVNFLAYFVPVRWLKLYLHLQDFSIIHLFNLFPLACELYNFVLQNIQLFPWCVNSVYIREHLVLAYVERLISTASIFFWLLFEGSKLHELSLQIMQYIWDMPKNWSTIYNWGLLVLSFIINTFPIIKSLGCFNACKKGFTGPVNYLQGI